MRFFRRREAPAVSGVVRFPTDDPNLSDEEIVQQRIAWFDWYNQQRNVYAPPEGGPYTCPCCGHPTLQARARSEICPECDWEDDGQDDHDSAVVRGGPNGPLSLDASRAAYDATGAPRGRHFPPADPL